MLCSLALLLLIDPGAPGVVQKKAQAQVEVTAAVLRLPEMASSTQAAHKDYGRIRPLIEGELADIERELSSLYATAEGRAGLPGSLRVPKALAEEAGFLNGILSDERHAELEKPVVEAWNALTGALVLTGLARHDGGPSREVSQESLRQAREVATSMRRKQLNAGEFRAPVQGGPGSIREAVNAPAPWPDEYTNSMAMMRNNHDWRVTQSMHVVKAINRQAPDLAQRWSPLVEHMNGCARRLLDFERTSAPVPHEGMKQLRVHARIQFLERFRADLWFSCVVWAHMASDEPPAPLKSLGS